LAAGRSFQNEIDHRRRLAGLPDEQGDIDMDGVEAGLTAAAGSLMARISRSFYDVDQSIDAIWK